MLVPFAYLLLRALEADAGTLSDIVFRQRNLLLLVNTLSLVGTVLFLGTLIAMPLAWLVVRSDIGCRKLVSILGVLPLAVPGYVMAYAIIGLSGYYGFANQIFGVSLPRPQGLVGATAALTLYTFPYLFLNFRAALMGIDPGLEASARCLGRTSWNAFWKVVIPHMMPAILAGWLVVGLYVLGDFGAVALMRYEVFSYAIYTQYSGAFDRIYAAWLSLMLMGVTVFFVIVEARLRGRNYARIAQGAARGPAPVALGRWRPLVWLFLAIVFGASLGLPLMVLGYWMAVAGVGIDWQPLVEAFARTTMVAAPAALIATALALPVVYLTVRYPSPLSTVIDRLAYLGYAVPPLAFGLSMVFFSLNVVPALYQSLPILIFAYCMTFLALALGPIRSRILQIGPRLEEVSRSLGHSPLKAFMRSTFPLLRSSMLASSLLVFIMIVKELPITFLLAPTGYRTLSLAVFSHTSEGALMDAAPYALMIVLFSSLFVGLILRYEGRR